VFTLYKWAFRIILLAALLSPLVWPLPIVVRDADLPGTGYKSSTTLTDDSAVVTTISGTALEIEVATSGNTRTIGIIDPLPDSKVADTITASNYLLLAGGTMSGAIAGITNLTNTGINVYTPPATLSFTGVSGTFTVAATYLKFESDGDYALTSTPNVANGTSGQILILHNADAAQTITVQDQGTLPDSGLELNAGTVALGPGDILQLIYNGTDWYQLTPVSNN
jgi:hypothetical protein